MTAGVLDLSDVTLRRGAKLILDQVSWQVNEGEHWVMLGPNGAGKTTVLQLAAARMHPTTGTVRVLGQRLGAVDVFELRPRIGFASAILGGRIPMGERVADAVVTGAYGVTGRWNEAYQGFDTDRALALLATFGVADLAQRAYGTLSEGERKRVQLARAYMADPELLLLDEPTAGLDVAGREQLIAILTGLARQPGSPVMVVVTHHLEEIPPGFTHAALMRQGRVVQAGPIDQVLTSPLVSAAFGMPLTVHRWGERWLAQGDVGGAS